MDDYATVPTIQNANCAVQSVNNNVQGVYNNVQDVNNNVQDVISSVQDVNNNVQDVNNNVQDVYNNVQDDYNIRYGNARENNMRENNMRDNNMRYKSVFRFNPAPPMFVVFHTIISVFAIYLSFKCNNGVNIGELLVAILCPVLYVLYKVAISPDLCGIRK
jgi:hypothetical protein